MSVTATPPLLSGPASYTASVAADQSLRIGAHPCDAEADTSHLLELVSRLRAEEPRILGYPGNLNFSFEALGPALSVFFNNVGDPDSADSSGMHAKTYEQAVLRFFAETAGTTLDEVWGYMTASGSEGVLYGLATARRALPHAHVYASDQAHYSVPKAIDLMGMQLVTIPSLADGTMDPQSLKAAAFANRRLNPRLGKGPGAIVLASIGTTMRGAVDDVVALRRMGSAAGAVYLHADAAAGGLVAAHAPSSPPWNFRHGVDSLSMSGHKILGSPIPTGVVLVHRDFTPPASGAEYIGASDRTLGCSRSGLASVLMWSALRRLGHSGLRSLIHDCLDVAEYATQQLALADANPSRFPDSLTVCFDRPADSIVRKWHLACEGPRAHVVCVGHVSTAAVDQLCRDLASGTAS
ncbi:histidine decarboxylase [Streptomyces sp. SYSU K217416]